MSAATRRFPLLRRAVKFGTFGIAVTSTAVMLPPKEMLPDRLLYLRVLFEGIGRLLRCCGVGLMILYDYKRNLRDDSSQEEWDAVHLRSAKKLVMLAETNGGLYVKAGQGFATMNHLLPPQYWRTMRSLQDAVLTRPYSEVVAVVEHDLKKPIDELFESFSPNPIAAASLAQVHRATLKGSGKEVAVKVQYIDIAQRFDGDMATINLMFTICGIMFPGYDFSRIISRAEDTLLAELDFVAEARNSERARALMKPVFGNDATTPNVRWELTTPRVLVTDFVNGVKISDAEGMKRLGISRKFCARTFINVFAHQIFETGFIHADPHPGNALVHVVNGKPQLVVLDHGLYTEITPEQRHFIASLWTAMTTHNDGDLARVSKSIGVSDWGLLASIFLQHPYDVFDPYKSRATLKDLDVMRNHAAGHMDAITEIIEAMPKEYGLVLRNITTVRSVNKDLGNPVSRTAEMLKYSLRVSHRDDFWTRVKCLAKLYYHEWKTDAVMWYVTWRYPEVQTVLDEMFDMG